MSRRIPNAGRARGVSLIELMVALVLGLIVTGSALTLVMTHRQTFAATEDMGRVQEGVRLAFELLNRELRGAGGNPCDASLPVSSGLNNPEANWWTDWADNVNGVGTTTAPPLRGYGGATAFPDAAFGAALGDRVAGTDAIEVKAAVPASADVALLTDALVDPWEDDIEVNSTDGVAVGDLMMICNFNNVTIFRVTAFDAGASIEHSEGADPDDNADDVLFRADTAVDANYDAGSVIAKVHAARWYIGNADLDGDGVVDGRSLYRATMTNTGGNLAVAVDEIAQGVTDMQIGYLVRGALAYVGDEPAEDPVNGVGIDFDLLPNPIVGVRLTLVFSGDDRIGPNGERLERRMTHTIAIRGDAE